MKKILASAVVLLLAFQARAQIIILNDNMMVDRLATIKAAVVDSLTNEPIPYASFYVIPAKDTTISNFTLTDDKGLAKLEEVPFGNYTLHVEMMGYKPFVKTRYFRESEVDMGTIKLQQDEQFLKAAVVSDVGNPVVVKKDTVEFSASSFRVGTNDMLKDLIKRMPGMEITEDGKVKFNGQEIDKLTVGGRTFFFNDQSTALNNLPASIVDKIRVIDRESESARATGVQDTQREKVLDVALKKEYEKGWFGNVGLNAGATLVPKKEDEPLRDNRGLLYSGNALASAYSEKDQFTFIVNGQNVEASEGAIMIRIEGDDLDMDALESTFLDRGLSTAAQLGINANTSRIKNVETTFGANYKYGDTQTGSRSERTTYQADGNLVTTRDNGGRRFEHNVGTNLEFQKENGKFWFHVRPSFNYTRADATSTGSSKTLREQLEINRSERLTHSLSSSKSAGISADGTFRDIGGKKGRSLRLNTNLNYRTSGSDSQESSSLYYIGGEDLRALTYNGNGRSFSNGASLQYNEPLGEKWSARFNASYSLSQSSNLRDAFDAAGRNDYYSSESRNRYFRHEYGLTVRYTFAKQSYVGLGTNVAGILNETFSKSYGIEATAGKGEWEWQVMPTATFVHSKGTSRFQISVNTSSGKPSNNRMLPVLNISDLSRMSVGNVNLKSYTQSSIFADWTLSNPAKFSNLMLFVFGTIGTNQVSDATWYDAAGILYSVPVNVRKPSVNLTLSANYTTPLDAKKIWTLSLNGSLSFGNYTNYLAKGVLPALDKDQFNYSEFMADFWGDAAGDRFYSGQSGFAESNTQTYTPNLGVNLRLNQDRYSVRAGVSAGGRLGRYSNKPEANMNTFSGRVYVEGSYTTKHEFEFQTELGYQKYWGYAEGFNRPELQWDASITKSIGAFNLSLQLKDILNQTRNLSHTITANYQEDTYRLVMGRYFLIGVKWNFGKMNAQHSRRAQGAAFNMF